MLDTQVRARSWAQRWPAAVCATLFFLGTADQVFAVRAHGMTLRLAQVVMGVGLVVWWQTARKQFPKNNRKLLIAWAPFFGVFLAASLLSADPLPGLLKLAWFGFNFLGAYAWSRLFEREDLVLGYFSAYLVVVAVIVFDFYMGFGAGPANMIGYAQPTYGAPGREGWFRPHAFYYEPSYAAAGLGLAWALALTSVSSHAPRASAILAVAGIAALGVMFSRTGWLYALTVMLAIVAVGGNGRGTSLRRRALHLGAGGVVLLTLVLVLTPQANRAGMASLLRALGVSETSERICPIVDKWFPSWGLQCLEGAERERALPFNQPGEAPAKTSEGGRLVSWESALKRIEAHPLTGEGVVRRADKVISPTVPNTWLEITVEGGVFALVAFIWGLVTTIYRWGGLGRENRSVGVGLLVYFVVSWQFIQTFPRLDQWLSFWMALTAVSAVIGSRPTHATEAGNARQPQAHERA